MKHPKPHAIVFDLHNVLFRADYQHVMSQICALPRKMQLLAHAIHPRFIYEFFSMLPNSRVSEHYILHFANKFPNLRPFVEHGIALTNAQKPIEHMFEIISGLQANGHKIFIFSNIGPITLAALQEKFPRHFDCFTGIHVAQGSNNWIQKPQPAAFDLFIKKYQLHNHRIYFIDDKKKNIKVAKTFGIDAIHYTSIGSVQKKLQPLLR